MTATRVRRVKGVTGGFPVSDSRGPTAHRGPEESNARFAVLDGESAEKWASSDLNRSETFLLASLRGLRLTGFESSIGHSTATEHSRPRCRSARS
jgi:hypothetical protein